MRTDRTNGINHEKAGKTKLPEMILEPRHKSLADGIIRLALGEPDHMLHKQNGDLGHYEKKLEAEHEEFNAAMMILIKKGILSAERSDPRKQPDSYPIYPEVLASDPDFTIEVEVRKSGISKGSPEPTAIPA